MFGWYNVLLQPLASMKMLLLSVPSGGQGHRSRSKVKWVHFEDVPFHPLYQTDVRYNCIGDK